MKEKLDWKPNFHLLRFWLAFEVVIAHCRHIGGWHVFQFSIDPVPAFVCLSGFLIPGSYATSRGWGHFAWKRLLRVMPALIASFVLIGFLHGWQTVLPTAGYYATAGLMVFTGVANGPLWSLMLEEWLYTSHALSRIFRIWKAQLAGIACLICLVASFALDSAYHVAAINDVDRIFRAAASYFAGNLLYFNRAKLEQWPLAPAMIVIGVFGIIGIAPGFGALIALVTSVSAVLVAYRLPQIKWTPPDFSYGIYIYHMPILTAVLAGGAWGFQAFLWTAGLTFLASAISWFVIEEPALRLKGLPVGLSPAAAPAAQIRVLGELGITPIGSLGESDASVPPAGRG